eukprot:scaffold143495_cov25-Prasinocladus_malaysianus.AAC.1
MNESLNHWLVGWLIDYLIGNRHWQMTDSERADLWASVFIRSPTECVGRTLPKSCHAMLGQVRPADGSLLSMARLNAAHLLEGRLPGCRFDPAHACRLTLAVSPFQALFSNYQS